MDTQMSLDEVAAQMAADMAHPDLPNRLVKSGRGDMPMSRPGSSGAEGGFTPQAGGKVIDSAAKGGGAPNPMMINKMLAHQDQMDKAYTGANVTNEPGRQGPPAKAGDDVTNEPARQAGGGAGEPAQGQSQNADSPTRARKPGKVGGMGDGGADKGKNLSEDEDESTRKRKAGKVGMAKGGDDGYEDEADDEAEKSLITADDLIKSLQDLEAVAQGSTVPAPVERREELAAKLAAGTLNKSEMVELSDLMKSGTAFAKSEDAVVEPVEEPTPEEPLVKSYQEQFADDPELSDGYDVSPFLERHSQVMASALDQVQTTLAKSMDEQRGHTQAFNTQLAKSLTAMARHAQRQEQLIKSLQGRLETVENQPVPTRGVTRASQVLNKSLGASEVGSAQAGGLNRSQCADVLERMAARGIQRTQSGHEIQLSMAMLESGGQMAKSLYNDLVAFSQGENGSVNVR